MEDSPIPYNWKNAFFQSPDKLKAGAMLIGAALVVTLTGSDPAAIVASWAAAMERVLEWLYVAPKAKNVQDNKVLEGIELGKQLSASPGPIYNAGGIVSEWNPPTKPDDATEAYGSLP